ncbi:MAG: hypothetical protein J6T10_15440, partial [Methanobrevibacter sp.]|nr:hypothetical protein [Methanobrevibacter sp.]
MAWENFIISDDQGILSASELANIPETPNIGWYGTVKSKTSQSAVTTEFESRISGGSEIANDTNYIGSGNYKIIGVRTESSTNYIGVKLYDDTTLYGDSVKSESSSGGYTWFHGKFFCLVDESRQYGLIGIVWSDWSLNAGRGYTNTLLLTNNNQFNTKELYYSWIYQLLKASTPIQYNWQSVPSISGKNGILSLTHVRNDSLLDGGSQTFTPEQVYVSEQTRVGHLMENVPIGKAIKAIFSGVNFLGIYKDTSTTNTVRMVLTEHIQREIFQSSFITDKCYIGFIMDTEQTAGRIGIFFPQYEPLTEILTGYHVDFTDTDYSETDVYNWLQGGIDADTPEINQPNEGTPEDYQPDIPITGITKPSYGAIETGFTTMFRCSKGELQRLSAFLWSSSFVDNVKKFFNDPREIIVGLSIMPVLPDTDEEAAEIKAGGISTGVYGLKLTDQYKLDTYGVIEVKATKGNFLDYAPYTSVTAHLPFVGEHTLDVNDVMGKQLVLKYIFDFLTGSCVAEIDVYDDGEFKPRYFFGGSCGIQVPTSSEDFG